MSGAPGYSGDSGLPGTSGIKGHRGDRGDMVTILHLHWKQPSAVKLTFVCLRFLLSYLRDTLVRKDDVAEKAGKDTR